MKFRLPLSFICLSVLFPGLWFSTLFVSLSAAPKISTVEKKEEPPSEPVYTSTCRVDYDGKRNARLNLPWETLFERSRQKSTHEQVMQGTNWKKRAVFSAKRNALPRGFNGRIWIRCILNLKGDLPSGKALLVSKASRNDAIFLNGKKARVAVRRISSGKTNEIVYSLDAKLWKPGPNLLTLRLDRPGGAIASGISPLLTAEGIRAESFLLKTWLSNFAAALYFFVAFAALLLIGRNNKETIAFIIFSAAMGFYCLMQTSIVLDFIQSDGLRIRIEHLMLALSPVALLLYTIEPTKRPIPLAVKILFVYYLLMFLSLIMAVNPEEWRMTLNAARVGIAASALLGAWFILKDFRHRETGLNHRFALGIWLLLFFAPIALLTLAEEFKFIPSIHLPELSLTPVPVALGILFSMLQCLRKTHSILDADQKEQNVQKEKIPALDRIENVLRPILSDLQVGIDSMRTSLSKKEKAKLDVSSIEKPMGRLRTVIHDSTLLALLNNGDYAVRKTKFKVCALAQETIEELLKANNIPSDRLKKNFPETDMEIPGDPDLIAAALRHLLVNALSHSRGIVELSLVREKAALLISVRDEGPSIPLEDTKRIFQPFESAEQIGPENFRMGIGLAIVQGIARFSGGSISLDTTSGYYNVFSLSLPVQWEAT